MIIIMLNRKGFTLVELLAALVILALIMAAAVPNVMGMISRNKAEAYVEDAKKLATRAEYVMRGDTSINKPIAGESNCIFFSLGYLNNGEFNDPPNGGAYYANRSFVKACKESSAYVYYVQLFECGDHSRDVCQGSFGKGITLHKQEDLTTGSLNSLVKLGKATTATDIITAAAGRTSYCATTCSDIDIENDTSGLCFSCTRSDKTDNGSDILIKDLNDD